MGRAHHARAEREHAPRCSNGSATPTRPTSACSTISRGSAAIRPRRARRTTFSTCPTPSDADAVAHALDARRLVDRGRAERGCVARRRDAGAQRSRRSSSTRRARGSTRSPPSTAALRRLGSADDLGGLLRQSPPRTESPPLRPRRGCGRREELDAPRDDLDRVAPLALLLPRPALQAAVDADPVALAEVLGAELAPGGPTPRPRRSRRRRRDCRGRPRAGSSRPSSPLPTSRSSTSVARLPIRLHAVHGLEGRRAMRHERVKASAGISGKS